MPLVSMPDQLEVLLVLVAGGLLAGATVGSTRADLNSSVATQCSHQITRSAAAITTISRTILISLVMTLKFSVASPIA